MPEEFEKESNDAPVHDSSHDECDELLELNLSHPVAYAFARRRRLADSISQEASYERLVNDDFLERLCDVGYISHLASKELGPLKIGDYRIIKPLGIGGMGQVWLAEQDQPIKRQVAIKVIKSGVESKAIIGRFESERQALALMNHPNIAGIFDAGTTPEGQLYFVMELVAGSTIIDYCDQNQIGINERLKLFLQVCSGVQHAHQKGIIHRDLKPGNIMVATHGDRPVAKIIDFGLAKAMESEMQLSDQSLQTGIGQVLGTLRYMSPEQASLSNRDIDTRADIYSLGVMLYELLTGSTPMDDVSIKGIPVLKVLEFICEREPPLPSVKLGNSSSAELASITLQRKTDRSTLQRVLIGDLDWVVMKALDKDRNRRYESASGLAADLERYLNNEPVLARPPSLNYRLQKFVWKNRLAVLAATLVSGSLVVGLIGTAWGLIQAQFAKAEAVAARNAESKRADGEASAKRDAQESLQISQKRLLQVEKGADLLASIFKDLNNESEIDGEEPLRSVLANRLIEAVNKIDEESIADPLIVAKLQTNLGTSLYNLGYEREAITPLVKALDTRSRFLGEHHADTLVTLGTLASAYNGAGEFEMALPLYQETLEKRTLLLGPSHPDTITAMNNLGVGYRAAGRFQNAVPLMERVLELRIEHAGESHPDTLWAKNNLAAAYHDIGEWKKAMEILEDVLAIRRADLGERHPHTLRSMNNLGMSYLNAGRHTEAIPLLEKTLDLIRNILGQSHPLTLESLGNLADGYRRTNMTSEALSLAESRYELSKDKYGEQTTETALSIRGVADCHRQNGDFDEALPLYQTALTTHAKLLGVNHPTTLKSKNDLALCYLALGKFTESLELLDEVLEVQNATLGATHPETLIAMGNLAKVYKELGKLSVAVPLLLKTYQLRKTHLGEEHSLTLDAQSDLAFGYLAINDVGKALPLFEETLRSRQNLYGDDDVRTLNSMRNLAFALQTAGDLEPALALNKLTLELMTKRLGADHPDTLSTLSALGVCYYSLSQFRESLSCYKKAFEFSRSRLGLEHEDTIQRLANLGDNYKVLGRTDEAIPLLEQALELTKTKYGDEHESTFNRMADIGGAYADAGRFEEAIPMLELAYGARLSYPDLAWVGRRMLSAYFSANRKNEALALVKVMAEEARKTQPAESLPLGGTLVGLGTTLIKLDEFQEAERFIAEGLTIWQKSAPDSWETSNIASFLGAALSGQGKMAEAEPLLLDGYDGLVKRSESIPASVRREILGEAIERLIKLYTTLEQADEIEKWKAKKAALKN